MAGDGKKGILDQLLEEAAALGRREASQGDYAVNLSTTDADGSKHTIEGIPVSRVGKDFLARFGITDDGGGQGEGQGDGGGQGEGEGQGDGGGSPSPLRRAFFGEGQGGKGKAAG